MRPLSLIQYSFARKEHEIDIKPHGNSKKKGAFQRTKPSTLKLIKASMAENKHPLKILKEVERSQGGVMQAKLGCSLPRNRRQVYNFKSAHGSKHESTGIPHSDTLAQVMKERRHLVVRPLYTLYKLLRSPCVFWRPTSNSVMSNASVQAHHHHLFSRLILLSALDLSM